MAVLPPQSLAFESEHFLLRTLTAEDASERLTGWSEDELAAEMLNAKQRRWAVEEQAAFFSRYAKSRDRRLVGVLPKGEPRPIGFFRLELRPEVGTFVITHLIGDLEWRGKEVTGEASDAVYDYLFNKLGYAKAKANVRPQNRPMLWLMLRGGLWRKEGRLLGHLRDAATGKRTDLVVLGMLADEWRQTVRDRPAWLHSKHMTDS